MVGMWFVCGGRTDVLPHPHRNTAPNTIHTYIKKQKKHHRVFVLLNSTLLGLVFRNLVLGVLNVNKEPEEVCVSYIHIYNSCAICYVYIYMFSMRGAVGKPTWGYPPLRKHPTN